MSNVRSENILYPIFSGVNDQPIQPSENSPGNGADFIARYNNLVNAIAPQLQLDFTQGIGITIDSFSVLVPSVPFPIYANNPSQISWEVVTNIIDPSGIVDVPLPFSGFNSVFAVTLFASDAYGSNTPVDDLFWYPIGVDGLASFVDLPSVFTSIDAYGSSYGWNNTVGIYPIQPNLKIRLQPTFSKPTVNQVIVSSPF